MVASPVPSSLEVCHSIRLESVSLQLFWLVSLLFIYVPYNKEGSKGIGSYRSVATHFIGAPYRSVATQFDPLYFGLVASLVPFSLEFCHSILLESVYLQLY